MFETNIFVFLVSSYLCIHYEVFLKNKNTTDLHNQLTPRGGNIQNKSVFSLESLGSKTKNREQTNLLILTTDMVLHCKPKHYLRPFFDGTMARAPGGTGI